MISYIILAGVLLAVFAAIQLGQNIYMVKLADDQNTKEFKKMAFWGIIVSSVMIGVGLVIIGISIFVHFQKPPMPKHLQSSVKPPPQPAKKSVQPPQPVKKPAQPLPKKSVQLPKKSVQPLPKKSVQPLSKKSSQLPVGRAGPLPKGPAHPLPVKGLA